MEHTRGPKQCCISSGWEGAASPSPPWWYLHHNKAISPSPRGKGFSTQAVCSQCLIIWAFCHPSANKAEAAAWLVYHFTFSQHWFSCSPYLLHKKRGKELVLACSPSLFLSLSPVRSFWEPLFLVWDKPCFISGHASWIINPFVNVYGDICSGKSYASLFICVTVLVGGEVGFFRNCEAHKIVFRLGFFVVSCWAKLLCDF